ncbi:MAG: nicotinamide-nucleotide amidohydrolase family protein [Synergistaceae bacterium]|nr:nicotinamide-nucleotide amidohydrolase family protein [Synergistaceae bacterium]
MKTAVLIAIGDELLSGIRREGNCAWLAWLLHDAGWRVLGMEVVPDESLQIVRELERWVGRTDLLVLSGGLGPTHDDRTRYALAEYLGCGLSVNDELYDRIAARYRGTSLEELIERCRQIQGLIPTESKGVYNPGGSALGIYFERSGTRLWSFPGVPFEFKAMVKQELTFLLSPDVLGNASHAWKSVGVVGIPESRAAELVPEVVSDQRLHISILPSFDLVEFVIRGEASLVDSSARLLRQRFAGNVLPEGCASLPEAILSTGREKGLSLSCAESCTGGMIGAALTDIPGSSDVFAGSAVVYSNEAKQNLLGVDPSILRARGAVSGECAEAMARGALERYGTSVSVAVTGIAGPEGGSPEKPVGTVWFGLAFWTEKKSGEKSEEKSEEKPEEKSGENDERGRVESYSFVCQLEGERDLVRERAVRVALISVWRKMAN